MIQDTKARDPSPVDESGARRHRCIAIVGPLQGGKTTLLEAILARAGAIQRQGDVAFKTSVGDACAESRAHGMSTEANVATVDFMGDAYTFIDCPGSIEFAAESLTVLPAVDAAIVVCDSDEKKIPALQTVLHTLESLGVPRFLFVNKIDESTQTAQDLVRLLQPASRVPLLLRQILTWKNGIAVGSIDLALERAFIYQEHAPSRVIDIPADAVSEERDALYAMLERLSDHDDALVEALLEEVKPPRDRIFDDLARELREGLAVPVLVGAARRGNGVLRLMKALRHETPATDATVKRLGVESDGDPLALVVKTLHTAHAGKLSVARVLRGSIKDGALLSTAAGERVRISGLFQMIGQTSLKIGEASTGATGAFGRLGGVSTGDTVSTGKSADPILLPERPAPVMAQVVQARERKDDVKLSAALAKLIDEDFGLILETNAELGETILHGQGPLHLRIAVEKLSSRFGVAVDVRPPRIAYRETIRKTATGVRGRHRKQSGGHGQFGDVVIDVAPLPPGSGIVFIDKVTGGAVPRQYIASVEEGIRSALKTGPLGFPVVDLSVALVDGSYHSVDSSDMAFQLAGRLAINDALSRCYAVLLEPVDRVEIFVPSSATAKATALVSSRRGQILGFDRRPGWENWDVVRALMPEAEMGDMIIELRSISSGVATYRAAPDHFAELVGRDAELVLAAKRAPA